MIWGLNILLPANEVWGKAIFSQACHSSCPRGGEVLPPGEVRQTPLNGYHGIWSTSGRYASYWNTFLFNNASMLCISDSLEGLTKCKILATEYSTNETIK